MDIFEVTKHIIDCRIGILLSAEHIRREMGMPQPSKRWIRVLNIDESFEDFLLNKNRHRVYFLHSRVGDGY
jgi:hypothetical protein